MDDTNQLKNNKTRRTVTNKIDYNLDGKIPPHNRDAEEAVLGAMLIEKDAVTEVIDILNPDCFYFEQHKKIYNAILQLFNRTEPVDLITVVNELKRTAELEITGGPAYLSRLTNRVASSANIERHSRIILQKYIQRQLIKVSSEIITDAFDESKDVLDVLDNSESKLFEIADQNFKKKYSPVGDLLKEALENIENAKNNENQIVGLPSGFKGIDEVTSGWQKSDLVIIAARPGMGKTAFILSMARNIALDANKGIAVFSLEMTALQLVNRLIAMESELDSSKLKTGKLENHEWLQLNARISKLSKAPIYIDDTPALSILELRAKCRRMKAEYNIQMVIIDYLQLMTAGSESKGNREQEISMISRSLKALAKELNVPVIALSQLSRQVEQRGSSKKPQLSDLRESGAIEQDADMVMFIYRPEYYGIMEDEDNMPTQGLAKIIIAKNRHGSVTDVNLRFIGNILKFTDYQTNSFNSGIENVLTPNVNFENNAVTFASKLNVMNDEDDENIPF
jgi:replicative DNA helicase